jgi:Holliday junction DNA helicase RuvA
MISHLRGTIERRGVNSVVLDVGGVGYQVSVPLSADGKLPAAGREVKLFIVESVAMYGGSTTLYGFLSEEERDIFLLLRDEVPGTGAKKALDYLDKVAKSLPDFRRCIVGRDVTALTGLFGFTKKTAEKLVAALKDKIADIPLSGTEKWTPAAAALPSHEAIAGLVALGYREPQARQAVEKAAAVLENAEQCAVEELIRRSLQYLS